MWLSSANSHEQLVRRLTENGVMKTPRVVEAFKKVDRGLFVPELPQGERIPIAAVAYQDAPFKIGKTVAARVSVRCLVPLFLRCRERALVCAAHVCISCRGAGCARSVAGWLLLPII